jgi:hypothetical protein
MKYSYFYDSKLQQRLIPGVRCHVNCNYVRTLYRSAGLGSTALWGSPPADRQSRLADSLTRVRGLSGTHQKTCWVTFWRIFRPRQGAIFFPVTAAFAFLDRGNFFILLGCQI